MSICATCYQPTLSIRNQNLQCSWTGVWYSRLLQKKKSATDRGYWHLVRSLHDFFDDSDLALPSSLERSDVLQVAHSTYTPAIYWASLASIRQSVSRACSRDETGRLGVAQCTTVQPFYRRGLGAWWTRWSVKRFT